MRKFQAILGVSICLVGCLPEGGKSPENALSREVITLQAPDGRSEEFVVEFANEPEAHARGLMFREDLDPSEGMLFLFDEPQPRAFWMKDTWVPLDAIFFDEHRAFVSWISMLPCQEDPCQTYPSEGPAQYVLEVPKGTAERLKIGVGWKLMYE